MRDEFVNGHDEEMVQSMIGSMTPRERVFARLAGQPVDRIPNLSIIMTFASKYIGKRYDEYVQDYRILVEGNLRCCEDFGIDMLSAISDPVREAHDFGAAVVFPHDTVPYAAQSFICEPGDLKKLKVSRACDGKRMNDRLEAITLYRQKAGKHYPVLGWVEGAIAEACDLHGISETMEDLYTRPDFMRELMEVCTQQAIVFAEAQVEAGADFIGIGDAAASLISPKMYQKFVLPYAQRIIDAVHRKGAKAKLHICGNISSLLNLLTETKADIIDVDYPVNFQDAVQKFGHGISACGNFEPSRILLQGSVEDVKNAVRNCAGQCLQNTFIAPGCEVPRDTPIENIRAVSESILEIAKYQ